MASRSSLPRSRRQYVLQSPALEIARRLPGVRGAPFPDFIEPALASLVPRPPKGGRWVCELKFDGYRFQMNKRETGTRMFTRRGHDWARTKNVVAAASQLKA